MVVVVVEVVVFKVSVYNDYLILLAVDDEEDPNPNCDHLAEIHCPQDGFNEEDFTHIDAASDLDDDEFVSNANDGDVVDPWTVDWQKYDFDTAKLKVFLSHFT